MRKHLIIGLLLCSATMTVQGIQERTKKIAYVCCNKDNISNIVGGTIKSATGGVILTTGVSLIYSEINNNPYANYLGIALTATGSLLWLTGIEKVWKGSFSCMWNNLKIAFQEEENGDNNV